MNDGHNGEPTTSVEGEYLPAQEPAAGAAFGERERSAWWRRLGPAGAGIAFLALKFKSVLALLLQFKLFFVLLKGVTYGWTFFLSLFLYIAVFGWRIGVVLAFVLVAHELGHFFAFRAYGLPVRLPVFVPFLGAYTVGAVPQDLEEDAYIALAGPFTGLVIGTAAYGFALATNSNFWYACADLSAFLNLFNMIPSPPFDGGRVIGAIWPPLWIGGFIAFIAFALFTHIPVFFVVLIGLIGLPSIVSRLRGNVDPRAATMTNAARLRVTLWYLGTAFGLFYVMGQAHTMAAAR